MGRKETGLMGRCKTECSDGETECCIYCEKKKKFCPDKCNIMDGYEYAEECEEYETGRRR